MTARGFGERDAQRIGRAVIKSERDSGGPFGGPQGATPRPQKLLLVRLTEDLEANAEVLATVLLENEDGDDWIETSDKRLIRLGGPDRGTIAATVDEPVDVWVVSHRGRWYVLHAGENCADRNEIWQITEFGAPTGGQFKLKGVYVNGVSEDVTIDYNASASGAQTSFELHSEIASGDITVAGGPLPAASLLVEFTGALAGMRQAIVFTDVSSLTGGTTPQVLVSRMQPGHPRTYA